MPIGQSLQARTLRSMLPRGQTLGSGFAIQQLVILMVWGRSYSSDPSALTYFSPDKQLLHQLVPLGVFFFRFLVPARTNQLHALHGPINLLTGV